MRHESMSRLRRAFTLIEMLTVLAITAVLLTLIIVPVVQSFNLTRDGQAFADAQDKARIVVERVSREIGNSAGVRDNTGLKGAIAVLVPGRNNTLIAPILLEYTKIDVVRPAEGDPLRGPTGALINPNTGREDPTLVTPKGQMVVPVTPGDSITRYFIGLRDPLSLLGYNNPYDGLLTTRSAARDNLYVLYRVEARPYVWDRINNRYVVNTQLFEVDPATVVLGDPFSGAPILDDPYFFLQGFDRFGAILAGPALAAKQQRVQRWLSRATLVTEVSRIDMIQAVFDKASRGVVYDLNVPRLLPLVQFRPTAMGTEPAEGNTAARLSEESDGMAAFAPDTFRTRFGGWGNLLVRAWPATFDPSNVASNDYEIGRREATVSGDRFSLFLFDPDTDVSELTDGLKLYDVTTYEHAVKNGLSYPFSRGLWAPNLGPAYNRSRLLAFVPHTGTGKLSSNFPIEEVGDFTIPPPLGGNAPRSLTGAALSPVQVPNPPGTLFDPQYTPSNPAYEINSSFNKVWETRPELRPNIHRFMDLRVVTQADGTPSPLHPDAAVGLSRARIVPGSEVVVGPDQNPGPNYGQSIRYDRTSRTPGPNQYRLNYTDLAEPTDYTLLGFAPGEVATFLALGGTYTPTNFLSAFFQPRYRQGYLQLYSDPNVPVPVGNIVVSFRFQFTRAGDAVAVDYDSRQVITTLLTIRNYPQSTLPNPKTVTLKATAPVRNVLR